LEEKLHLLSIIIPVKNEPYLPQLVNRIRQLRLGYDIHIHIQNELGLANAVLCGVRSSAGEVICVLDADGSHSPKYIPSMIQRLRDADIIVGSRYVKGGGTQDYFMRMLLSRFFCKVARAVLRLKVNDNMSGFIVAKREVFDQLHLQPFGYKFGLEMIVKSKGKFVIMEHPVVFERRKMGYSKTGLGQGMKTFIFILKLWIMELMEHEF
jgi:dolichol-phosphate mannosyltransferase